MKQVSKVLFALVFGLALGCLVSAPAAGQGRKPNILVIMGDDIGQASISVFTKGLMGYRTPSIDRTAKEGMLFTDYYAEQSCTAGRSSFLTGQEAKSPRREFLYFSDDCDLVGLRYENYKFVFMEQRTPGTLATWTEPFTRLRAGKMFELRADPYERADITSNTCHDWTMDHLFLIVPSQVYIVRFIETFKEFPPRQKSASFGIDQALESVQQMTGGR